MKQKHIVLIFFIFLFLINPTYSFAQQNNIWETIIGDVKQASGGKIGNWEPGNFAPPFKCGLRYYGSTYPAHSNWSVDFNGVGRQELGEPVRASAPGKVEWTEPSNGEIFINHPSGYGSLYVHMRKFYVKKDDFVKQGQVIGEIGNVGNSSGPHLHVNQYKNGQRIKVSYNKIPYPASLPEGNKRTGPTITGPCP